MHYIKIQYGISSNSEYDQNEILCDQQNNKNNDQLP